MIFQADIGVCGQKVRQPQQEGQNYHNKEQKRRKTRACTTGEDAAVRGEERTVVTNKMFAAKVVACCGREGRRQFNFDTCEGCVHSHSWT